jgi:single-strand DNA-binding protein
MNLNKVILGGRLTADPEIKKTGSGVAVTSFTIAVDRKYSKDSEKKADFITIVAWRQQAEFVSRYFKRGKPILICGQLQTRTWTDKQGNKRYATEVVAEEVSFVESKDSSTEAKNEASAYMPSAYQAPSAAFEEIPDGQGLPF